METGCLARVSLCLSTIASRFLSTFWCSAQLGAATGWRGLLARLSVHQVRGRNAALIRWRNKGWQCLLHTQEPPQLGVGVDYELGNSYQSLDANTS